MKKTVETKTTKKIVKNGFVYSNVHEAIDKLSYSIDLVILELIKKESYENRNNNKL